MQAFGVVTGHRHKTLLDNFVVGNASFSNKVFSSFFQTGELMENVDLKICFLMEDRANVIHLLMHTKKAHAVPPRAGVGTLMHTAPVQVALTTGNF